MATTARRLRAFNTATASENRVHDDEVARRLGFRGGLVPGVDVYAYLTSAVVAEWGVAWLESGRIEARFARPVYDGEEVDIAVEPVADGGGDEAGLSVSVRTAGVDAATDTGSGPASGGAADVRAVGVATLGTAGGVAAQVPEIPDAPLPARRPPASRDTLAAGTVLGSIHVPFVADGAMEAYLADVREDQAVYRDQRIAHPAWLLRQANAVLMANVTLGPWLHVGSGVRHLALVHDGDTIGVRARVAAVYERRGHELVELDVVLQTHVPVAVVHHTAIFRPRGLEAPG